MGTVRVSARPWSWYVWIETVDSAQQIRSQLVGKLTDIPGVGIMAEVFGHGYDPSTVIGRYHSLASARRAVVREYKRRFPDWFEELVRP